MQEKQKLTFQPKKKDREVKPILMFKDLRDRQYLGVPRAYAKDRFKGFQFIDEMARGQPLSAPPPRRADPNHPSVKEPEKQAQFMAEMLRAAHEYGSFVGLAPTGSGKTVVGLDTAFELGHKLVVNLHLERLMVQWHDALTSVFGLDPAKIGIVQQDRCEWEDKDVVLAMMPSLAARRYAPEMYRSFGTAITDEVHRLGQSNLAPTVALFPAAHRIGLSATPDRKDGSDRVIYWQIGDIKARSEATAMECDVYVQEYNTSRTVWGQRHGARVKALTQDPNRNKLLVKNALRLLNARRQCLFIGEHVLHIQEIMRLLREAGVPSEIMGQFTGEMIETEEQTVRGKKRQVEVSRRKVTDAEYDHIKDNPNISAVFATYGIFQEGIDIPRLDAGMDLTPWPKATQVIGRVRRPGEGKRKSIWITMRDHHDWMSKKYFECRMREYKASGCSVIFDRL
jgi:superfamily II DNA or RNA helicase